MKKVHRRIKGFICVVISKLIYRSKISFSSIPVLEDKIHLYISKNGNIKIGKNLSARRDFEIRASSGSILIGGGCFFNNNCTLVSLKGIKIGENCIFGENVLIYDHDHRFRERRGLIKDQGFVIKEVVLGNNIWIGSNVTILKGVNIGDNSVIGANCVIYKDVPENTLVRAIRSYDFIKI